MRRQPCKLCGFPHSTLEHDPQIECWWVQCSNCAAEAAIAFTEAEAVEAWDAGTELQVLIPQRNLI